MERFRAECRNNRLHRATKHAVVLIQLARRWIAVFLHEFRQKISQRSVVLVWIVIQGQKPENQFNIALPLVLSTLAENQAPFVSFVELQQHIIELAVKDAVADFL